eukprot:TRINITY_DN3048_c0_g1_i3.p1 TRINITY_DN3048_c0_g1~~TRINITY_DN3048_c0_g1_i3.p1  ORF type:complete len:446 (+),score=97.67 TRINITY_DN3048_c0_g1_i3:102-1439(+)
MADELTLPEDQVASLAFAAARAAKNFPDDEIEETQIPAPNKTPFCKHPRSCAGNSIKGALKSFSIGFGIKSSINLITSLVFQRKLLSKPLEFVKHVFGPDSLRFGAFLGLFTGSFKIVQCLARHLRQKEDHFNSLLAGCLASFSILVDDSERQKTFSLYLLVRAMDLLYHSGVRHQVISKFEHRDIFLFCVACCVIMYCWHFNKDMLPKSYHSWISQRGGVDIRILNATCNVADQAPYDLASWCKANNIPEYNDPNTKLIPCEVLHPRHPHSCSNNVIERWWLGFLSALPVYLPIHFLPLLLFRSGLLLKKPVETTLQTSKAVVMSASFLTTFQASFWTILCLGRNTFQRDTRITTLLAGFISGLAVLFEKKGRRAELMIFCMPRVLELTWKMLAKNQYLPESVAHGHLALFSAAMAVIMTFYQHEPTTIKESYYKAMKKFFGDN